MPELTATCYFRVVQPTLFPVVAAPMDALAIVPLPLNVWVIDPSGRWVVRRAAFPEAKLWTALDDLLEREIIRYLDGEALRRHPLPQPVAMSRPSLRVIRAG